MAIVRRSLTVFFMIGLCVTAGTARQFYVSGSGNNSNTGLSIDAPFLTIAKAVSSVAAGDTIFVRGGVYAFTGSSTAVTLPAVTGTSAAVRCLLMGYNGERALLDFSAMTGTSADGLKVNGSFWYIRGFDCKGAPHNGIKISGGSNNTIEFCTSFNNRNTGVQLAAGASNNRIINCDSYYNYDDTGDTLTSGGNADGFSPKLDVGTGNYFYGCRSWRNSDDGWDGYLRPSDDVSTTIENCWAFMNGFLKDGITTYPSMNGNGFKTGGSDSKLLKHNSTVKNCLAFLNKAKGFDQNNNLGSITFLNCTGYKNGIGTSGGAYNFSVPAILAAGKVLTVENCISHSPTKAPGYTLGSQTSPVIATNSWMSPFAASTDADFLSVDTAGATGPRKADGSLPEITFMHLAPGSQFINAGTNVGLPFTGTAPDLGCFETSGPTSVREGAAGAATGYGLGQNFPNPFNPSTTITVSVPQAGPVTVTVRNVLGSEIAALYTGVMSAGVHELRFDGSRLCSGTYFCILQAGAATQVRRMLLLK